MCVSFFIRVLDQYIIIISIDQGLIRSIQFQSFLTYLDIADVTS